MGNHAGQEGRIIKKHEKQVGERKGKKEMDVEKIS
jgi:hypothetical protein